jgi:hypothetical protein
MVHDTPLLVRLMTLIDDIPLPPAPPGPRKRGHPVVYGDRLFLKALVLMVVRRLPTVHGLLAVLAEPEMAPVRARLTLADGRYPARRTWERRLGALPDTLPDLIALLGLHLVARLDPWADGGRAVAIDSTALRARGGVWHKKHREAGVVPHTSIDTEAHWTKSGWHGWVYGWKLHLLVTVAGVWIPLAADLTPANMADNEHAPALLGATPLNDLFVLGDTSYNDPAVRDHCVARRRTLVASKRGAYPHTDDGVEVRRIFHELRSRAIENFNGQFKGIFDVTDAVPTRGRRNTRRFVLGAVLVYQLALLHCSLSGRNLRLGLKPLLQAA